MGAGETESRHARLCGTEENERLVGVLVDVAAEPAREVVAEDRVILDDDGVGAVRFERGGDAGEIAAPRIRSTDGTIHDERMRDREAIGDPGGQIAAARVKLDEEMRPVDR